MLKFLLHPRRFSRCRQAIRFFQWFAAFCILTFSFDLTREFRRSNPHVHQSITSQNLNNTKSVYIASVQWNSESILRSHWIPSLLDLVKALQAVHVNIYISIYENGSRDGTKKALSELEGSLTKMNINNTIKLDVETHEEVINKSKAQPSGWLETMYGKEFRRIPHLANIRNRALDPLIALNRAGIMFDKILYLNDVVYSANDAIALLNTKNGVYAAACGLDYINPPWNHVDSNISRRHPPGTYDDFATRDIHGHVLLSHLYPYYSSSKSKAAIISGSIIPVQSCWNGMVSFDGGPFQSLENPLRFRYIPDTLAQYHVEASECCLIHYDNPLSQKAGVWINPAVRVGYSSAAYAAVNSGGWPTKHELRWGNLKSRWTWWIRDPGPTVKAFLRKWQWQRQYPTVKEPGLTCVEDLAMVLTGDGWRYRGAKFE